MSPTGVVGRPDAFDGRRPRLDLPGTGPAASALLPFVDAGVLEAADARTALVLVDLAHLDQGAAGPVALAVALAVRAVRFGHVHADLATVATTAVPEDEAATPVEGALPWPEPSAWAEQVGASGLASAGDAGAGRPLRLVGTRLYLERFWQHERALLADVLRRTGATPPPIDAGVLADGLARLFPATEGDAGALQRVAAATALLRRFAVVAGGPGTGKTTTVARILALLHEQAAATGEPPPRVALCAPTGKAAARLAQAVHAEAAELPVGPDVRAALQATEATTLHRLLGWQPGNRSRFRHDAANQLPHAVVIVDESSMVPLALMAKLVVAVRSHARLVLVGDPRQLASVEAGAVLGDIVGPAVDGVLLSPPARAALDAVGAAPPAADGAGAAVHPPVADAIVVLRHVHRFGGGIAQLAAAIERGDAGAVLATLASGGVGDDLTWIDAGPTVDPTRAPELEAVRGSVVAAARAVVAAAREGDARAALDALGSVQVLCAHRRGPTGAAAWRYEIERWLRAAIPGYGHGPWYAGRPLLVTENDHGLGVYNGDTGVVVDVGGGRLRAAFDRRGDVLEVPPARLAAVESLYAMTIHKAQGSQFRQVVVRLPEPTSPVLTRELIYTAVTRAERRLVVIGSGPALTAAVERPIGRASGIPDALWG